MSEGMKWHEMTNEQKNVLIAEKVFLHKITVYDSILKDDQIYPVPNYTTDMNDAWKIVEKLHERYDVRILIESGFLYKYHIRLWGHNGKMGGYGYSNASMEDAICEAALRAVGVEIE